LKVKDFMKTCSKCKIEKELSNFSHYSKNTDGLQGVCKQCFCQRSKEWRLKNLDKCKEREKRYREENRETLKQRCAIWREKNPEKQKLSNQNYRANNPEKVKAQTQEWRSSHHSNLVEMRRRTYQRHRKKRMANSKNWALKNKEASREIKKREKKKARTLIKPSFVLSVLRLKAAIATPELIELKRAQLLLTRELRNAN
jgi:hypothetical protein